MRPDLNHFTHPRPPVQTEDIGQRLRELPAELPAPYDFDEFRARARNRFPARSTFVKWPHAAAAAGLTAFVAAMAMLGNGDSAQDPTDVTRGPGDPPAAHIAAADGARPPFVAGGAARSSQPLTSVQMQETREWLARQPAEPAVVRVVPRMAVASLEDRIAWFDDALTDERLQGMNDDYVNVLQQERARLMASLAQVRYAESLAADGS
jgi:hypothetical protein